MATQATLAALAKLTSLREGRARARGERRFRRRSGRGSSSSASPLTISCSIIPSIASTSPYLRSAAAHLAHAAKIEESAPLCLQARSSTAAKEEAGTSYGFARPIPGRGYSVDGCPRYRPRRGRPSAGGYGFRAAHPRRQRFVAPPASPSPISSISASAAPISVQPWLHSALSPFGRPELNSHFVSNVDGADIVGTFAGSTPRGRFSSSPRRASRPSRR